VSEETAAPLLAIFVGGASSRMGGHPKGLLRVLDGRSIVERWCDLGAEVGLRSVLVGDARAYAQLGMESVGDEVPGAGPLAGLCGLLKKGPLDYAQIVAVACDMPFVTADLLRRLAFTERDAPDAPDAPILAPRRGGRYEPLFARYDRARVLPLAERQLAGGDRSLQKLLRDAGARDFVLSEDEWPLLADWDEPADAGL
jgi:molybdopterin-guanine dinucleotide biosynthesis protein A